MTQGASTTLKHPWQAQAGLAYSGIRNWNLELDYVMVGFSAFSSIPLTFKGAASGSSTTLIEDYTNSWTVRVGAEHAFASGIKGRAGLSWVSTPVPDVTVTPLLPDQDRQTVMLGAGVPLGPTWSLDAAYMYVNTQGRRGRVVNRTNEIADRRGAQYRAGTSSPPTFFRSASRPTSKRHSGYGRIADG